MKKHMKYHKGQPNFILSNQSILHCFQGAIRDFSMRIAQPHPAVQPIVESQDFLIIDNDTGEIIKA